MSDRKTGTIRFLARRFVQLCNELSFESDPPVPLSVVLERAGEEPLAFDADRHILWTDYTPGDAMCSMRGFGSWIIARSIAVKAMGARLENTAISRNPDGTISIVRQPCERNIDRAGVSSWGS